MISCFADNYYFFLQLIFRGKSFPQNMLLCKVLTNSMSDNVICNFELPTQKQIFIKVIVINQTRVIPKDIENPKSILLK